MTHFLALETSCDETAAAVFTDEYAVKSSVVASQTALHARFGGVVPEIASRAHLRNLCPVIDEALEKAGISMADIGCVAHEPVVVVSHGGLIRVVERALGSVPHSVPNLGGLEIRRLADGTLELSGRTVLIDAHAVTVTSPPEV